MHIRVTAKVTFDYDTDDGLVETEAEAIDDVADILSQLSPDDFMFDTETNPV